jgi:hypothetical protein
MRDKFLFFFHERAQGASFILKAYCIAALAAWSVRSAAAMMTANPVENFTNSMKKGSIRRSAARRLLFF